MKQKVHLVLGSGGARGMAHIGVIEKLERHNYEIISVTGCSMGAVVGGIYCAGYLHHYKEWLLTLTRAKVFSMFDFTFTTKGFVKGEKVLNILQQFTGEQDIGKFKIPFTAVATDMLHHKEVHYQSGDLYRALRASMAIPGVFTPVFENGSFLVDGSVLNPLPLSLVKKSNDHEQVVAVNINAVAVKNPHHHRETHNTKKEIHEAAADAQGWLKKVSLPVIRKRKPQQQTPAFNLLDLLNHSFDFTQDRLTELIIQTNPPDVLVEVPRNTCGVFDFHKAKELIETGAYACEKALMEKQ